MSTSEQRSPQQPLRLSIAHTWDGTPLPVEEQAKLDLSATAEYLEIQLEAPFHGDPAPKTPVGSTDQLWEYEVVEIFIAGSPTENGPIPYLEIELSPHGHYLILKLEGIRQITERAHPTSYRATILGDQFHGKVQLPWSLLPPPPHRINAYRIHGQGPRRRYLAMVPVPGDQPDFHQPAYFMPVALPDPIKSPPSLKTSSRV